MLQNKEQVLFHVSQAWEVVGSGSSANWQLMREVYANAAIRARFPAGRSLKLNYRRAEAGQWSLQATAVWAEGPPPSGYRTKENLDDLIRMASNLKFNRNLPSSLFSKCRYSKTFKFFKVYGFCFIAVS
jgi:hypothetical protein